MTEQIQADAYETPFPHLILHNFYNDEELKLIWEELDFYTKPDKLLDVKEYLGVVDKTNAKAIYLDVVYPKKFRKLSNILTVNRKVFEPQVLEPFSKLHDCCLHSMQSNYDHTKVRYYHDGDFYEILIQIISLIFLLFPTSIVNQKDLKEVNYSSLNIITRLVAITTL